MAGSQQDRAALEDMVADELSAGERVLAVLPYAHVPARPKGPAGKVRDGIYQSNRRYRPIIVTDQRLILFETGRTHFPRGIHRVRDRRRRGRERHARAPRETRLVLELPEVGAVPFETGRNEQDDLAVLVETIGPAR